MASDRLSQVHQAELTESRLNADFVDFLRGPFWTYLLVILVAVAGWMGWVKWKQKRAHTVASAWTALSQAELPSSLEEVATVYADVPGLAVEARRLAGDALVRAVQTGQPLGTPLDLAGTQPASSLTADERTDYLLRADRMYREVLAADDGSLALTLQAVSALAGRAVIAESSGDPTQATAYFEQAAYRAEKFYPGLAERYRRRAKSTTAYTEPVTLPSNADLPPRAPATGLEPVRIEDVLRPLLPQ